MTNTNGNMLSANALSYGLATIMSWWTVNSLTEGTPYGATIMTGRPVTVCLQEPAVLPV
jgi:hypothetical protein